jgi:hypothetical protein
MSDEPQPQPQPEQPRCADTDCQVSRDCPLYLPGRLIRKTLRQNWESERIPCMARLRFEGGETPTIEFNGGR